MDSNESSCHDQDSKRKRFSFDFRRTRATEITRHHAVFDERTRDVNLCEYALLLERFTYALVPYIYPVLLPSPVHDLLPSTTLPRFFWCRSLSSSSIMLTSLLPCPPPLSRSASTSSVVSASASEGGSKRTRKRFSQEQVIVLEKMFQKTSHPSKGEREAVAKQTGMCVFSSSFSPPFSPLGRLNPTNQLVRNTGTSSQ